MVLFIVSVVVFNITMTSQTTSGEYFDPGFCPDIYSEGQELAAHYQRLVEDLGIYGCATPVSSNLPQRAASWIGIITSNELLPVLTVAQPMNSEQTEYSAEFCWFYGVIDRQELVYENLFALAADRSTYNAPGKEAAIDGLLAILPPRIIQIEKRLHYGRRP